ncbi:MAG: alpha/beta hydrolase [Cyclobacteriaceae bacterium]
MRYITSGEGPKTLIAFHGFGQEAKVFDNFSVSLSSEYTVYSFDLFYHGMSSRTVERPLTKELWSAGFNQFCIKESINSFEVLGFSFGGRFALAAMMTRPLQCEKIHLLAPDGINSSFWYEIATLPGVSEKVFKRLLNQPTQLIRFIQSAQKLKLMPASTLKFVMNQLETEEQRNLIYLTWTMFKPLKYSQKELASTINRHEIQTIFYLGRYDKIMSEEKFTSFARQLNFHRKFIVNCGHEQLIPKSIPFFLK